MKSINAIAVLGDKTFEGELQSSLPKFHVHRESFGRIRTLIRGNKVEFVATCFLEGQPKTSYRTIVREGLAHGIGTLFLASSPDQAYHVLERNMSQPGVFVAYQVGEFPTVMELLRERIKRHASSAVGGKTPPAEANLDGHPLIEQMTGFLRDRTSGRLDVKKVAGFYDEPLKRFSDALRVSQAAVSQTPNSKKYQDFLSYFERTARVLPLLESKDMFPAWAKTPNKELNGLTPLDLLFGGPEKAQKLVGVVEDVLVGQPD
jgi:hypothetical protein